MEFAINFFPWAWSVIDYERQGLLCAQYWLCQEFNQQQGHLVSLCTFITATHDCIVMCFTWFALSSSEKFQGTSIRYRHRTCLWWKRVRLYRFIFIAFFIKLCIEFGTKCCYFDIKTSWRNNKMDKNRPKLAKDNLFRFGMCWDV